MKKTVPSKLTDKEIKVLVDHILTDIEYGSGGSFHKFKDREYEFDEKDAKIVLKALSKIVGFDLNKEKYLG